MDSRAVFQDQDGCYRTVKSGDKFLGPDNEILVAVKIEGDYHEGEEPERGESPCDAAAFQATGREG